MVNTLWFVGYQTLWQHFIIRILSKPLAEAVSVMDTTGIENRYAAVFKAGTAGIIGCGYATGGQSHIDFPSRESTAGQALEAVQLLDRQDSGSSPEWRGGVGLGQRNRPSVPLHYRQLPFARMSGTCVIRLVSLK